MVPEIRPGPLASTMSPGTSWTIAEVLKLWSQKLGRAGFGCWPCFFSAVSKALRCAERAASIAANCAFGSVENNADSRRRPARRPRGDNDNGEVSATEGATEECCVDN